MKLSGFDSGKAPGTYALLIKLNNTRSITVGRLGDISFNAG